MGNRKAMLSPRKGNGYMILTSSLGTLDGGRVVVLLAAQPDARRPAVYRLVATVVPEQPLPPGLRLVVRWQGGGQAAAVDGGGCALIRGVPAAALQALGAGDRQALVLHFEKAESGQDALG